MAVLEALIDADLVAYRCAASCEQESSAGLAIYRCNELVERIIDAITATDFCLYLSGGDNFRKKINTEYKANRKDKPRPQWLQDCREFLVTEWNAIVTDGIEADDALGIAQREDTFICSLDKDMLQVPGMHYNWVKEEEYYITDKEGLKNFWTQVVTGDVADNVFGIRGLGPKKTAKLLDPIEDGEMTYEELDNAYYKLVAELYNDEDRLHSNCKLLWILRTDGGIWLSPKERLQIGQKDE